MNKKEKIATIKKYWNEGKIRKIGDGTFSVPSEFFTFGITPRLLKEVLSKK